MSTYTMLEAVHKRAKEHRDRAKIKNDMPTYDRYQAVAGLVEMALKRLETD